MHDGSGDVLLDTNKDDRNRMVKAAHVFSRRPTIDNLRILAKQLDVFAKAGPLSERVVEDASVTSNPGDSKSYEKVETGQSDPLDSEGSEEEE